MNKNLLMITGIGSGKNLAQGKQGAFYHTLDGLHHHFGRIDIIVPKINGPVVTNLFGNVHIHVSTWPLWLHPLFFISKGFSISRKYHFDLMTVQDFPPFYNGIGAFILYFLTGIPYVLEVHHVPGYPKSATTKEYLYRLYTRLFIGLDAARALWVRVVNQNQVPGFLNWAGIPSSKIRYVPSMYIDLEKFKPLETSKKYDFITVARLEKNKGIPGLLRAIALIKKTKPDVSILIVGAGPLEKPLKFLTEKIGLSKNVSFSGWVSEEEKIKLLRESRVFVNSSFNEGGPRSAVEAMACGLPIVTTRVGLMLDIVEDGKNGFFCDWNPNDMADVLVRTIHNDHLNKIGESARATASRFGKEEAIRDYADFLKKSNHNRLLVITQKVDKHDVALGFFIPWLQRLGDQINCSVLCLEKGEYYLKGVSVSSMGKENGNSRISRFLNFYSYVFRNHNNYDTVLVHMNPIWAVLGGWYWRLRGKKVILWYTHKSVTWKLRVASFFATVILTASKESFRLPSSKLIVTGHGIDTDVFRPENIEKNKEELKIITVGRIAPVKNYEVLISAAKILHNEGVPFHLSIVGEPALDKDIDYLGGLVESVSVNDLNSQVSFLGKVDHFNLPGLYAKQDMFIHMSNTGSLDKTILEAMACGLKVLSSNDAAKGFLPHHLVFDGKNAVDLADKIKDQSRSDLDSGLRDYVIKNHNLDGLIKKIVSVANS